MSTCLVAAPVTRHAETVVRACIAAGVDYLDVQFSSKKLQALYAAGEEIKQAAGYLNMKNIPYSEAVDELMESFIDYQAQVFKNGAWTKPSSWDSHTFNFGVDIGNRTCYSMFFEELRDIPNLIPTIKETGFTFQARTGSQTSSSRRLFLSD